MRLYLLSLVILYATMACNAQKPLQTGADQINTWSSALKGKQFALCVNHTSRVGNRLLVDTLISLGYRPTKLFGPEHGIRGQADAGELINTDLDPASGLKVISLYGKHKKPTAEDLKGLDLVVFDMQDVGVRFYTYLSTLHYLMESCAENNVKVLVLDRPNPLANVVDGPVLVDSSLQSFVGMHRIPIIHGMTLGELAGMINKEGWLKRQAKCQLDVVPLKHYYRTYNLSLTTPPSPNLRTDNAIKWYPTLCLLEGTPLSVGRGTDYPFEVWGGTHQQYGNFQFRPEPRPGAKTPALNGVQCYGENLTKVVAPVGIDYNLLIRAYKATPDSQKVKFFTPFFNKLAGDKSLALMIQEGKSAAEIRAVFATPLQTFERLRSKYLLYPVK